MKRGGACSQNYECASKIAFKEAKQLGHNFGKAMATTTKPISTMSSCKANLFIKANKTF